MSMTILGKEHFTTEEVAKILGISVPTIRKYRKEGKLKGVKFLKRWYYSKAAMGDFQKWALRKSAVEANKAVA